MPLSLLSAAKSLAMNCAIIAPRLFIMHVDFLRLICFLYSLLPVRLHSAPLILEDHSRWPEGDSGCLSYIWYHRENAIYLLVFAPLHVEFISRLRNLISDGVHNHTRMVIIFFTRFFDIVFPPILSSVYYNRIPPWYLPIHPNTHP